MQVTAGNFLKVVQNHVTECFAQKKPYTSCLDPNKHQRISDLFNSFSTKHSQFSNCESIGKFYFECPANDGTGDYLSLNTSPSEFGIAVLNDKKNIIDDSGFGTRWTGYSITCSPSVLPSDEKAYECVGTLPEDKRYSYSLMEKKSGVCEENYFSKSLKEPLTSDCKNGLSLFNKFLSNSTSEEGSLLSSGLSLAGLVVGTTATGYFGYKTFTELNHLWKSAQSEQANAQVQENSKKRAIIYTIATLSSLIFTSIAYCNK